MTLHSIPVPAGACVAASTATQSAAAVGLPSLLLQLSSVQPKNSGLSPVVVFPSVPYHGPQKLIHSTAVTV
ncbi:MAG: hypothetical protein VYE61_04740 [Pseudomonadota bacterium]|nr:hypothetical protein [Pseudomonadota bacterium]